MLADEFHAVTIVYTYYSTIVLGINIKLMYYVQCRHSLMSNCGGGDICCGAGREWASVSVPLWTFSHCRYFSGPYVVLYIDVMSSAH